MSILYADTSAVTRAYLADEPDHADLRAILLNGADVVVTSELTRIEFGSAIHAAGRAGQVPEKQGVLDHFDADCGDNGPITLLQFDPSEALPFARKLVLGHTIRTLDAIHLAVLMTDVTHFAAGEQVVLLTRDKEQAQVARDLGVPVL